MRSQIALATIAKSQRLDTRVPPSIPWSTMSTLVSRKSACPLLLEGGRWPMGPDRRMSGRISEVNILTTTKLRWWPFQLLGFFIARRSRWAAENLVHQSGLILHLKRLNFLHAGRWVALGRFPKAGLSWWQREWPWHRWVLFVANFNQTWRPYLVAFLDAFGSGVDSLWGESDGMPDHPLPNTRYATVGWIDRQLPFCDYYYAAYPHLSTNEVRCVVRVAREVSAYEAEQGITGNVTYRELPDQLKRSLQPCLIPIPSATTSMPPADPGHDGVVGLVACFPIRPGWVDELRGRLRSYHGWRSDRLFGRVGGIHFARLFVIDRLRPAPGRAEAVAQQLAGHVGRVRRHRR